MERNPGMRRGGRNIRDILQAADIVARLKQEYRVARQNFLPQPSS